VEDLNFRYNVTKKVTKLKKEKKLSFPKLIYLSIIILSIFFLGCDQEQSIKKNIIKKEDIPKKISMLFVLQPHCPSCDKLEATMKLEKPSQLIKKYFKRRTVYLGEKLPENLIKPNGTPTVYFLGYKDELLIQPMIGEKDEDALMIFLEDALLEFKTIYNVDLTLTQGDNNETNKTN